MTSLSRIATVAGLMTFAPAALAENLITNGDFAENIASWNHQPPADGFEKAWSSIDAADSPYSGSARVTVVTPEPLAAHAAVQCANGVVGGQAYTLSGEIFIPAGQDRAGHGASRVFWFPEIDCFLGPTVGDGFASSVVGAWTPGSRTVIAPADAKSVWVELGAGKAAPPGGSFRAHFDNFKLCRPAFCEDLGDEGWLTTGDFPDFRFRVTVTPIAAAPFFGQKVADCIPDALCVSGALAARAEALLRLIGPRPNGYLWLQVVRFTPSQLDVEVQQLSTSIVKSYRLDAIPPDEDRLEGLVDRTAFLP